jgi:enolase
LPAIAIDPAASSFLSGGAYDLSKSKGGRKTSNEMIAIYQKWIDTFPIVSIEDGLDENDWAGFARQTASHGQRIQIVGDDNFVTNPTFILRGIKEKTANAALTKLNQIGTVTETIEAIALCRKAGWNYVVSHRSGETEDVFLADFTVAMGAGRSRLDRRVGASA